jgi:UDP-N-acetylmuramoyl-tripeptide--D-alanyl-D-alanine ligase
MLELGSYESAGHREVGAEAVGCADLLVAVGERSREIAQGALDEGMDRRLVSHCGDADAATRLVEQLLQAGDTLLIKGSRGMAMERIVTAIKAEQDDG